MNGWKYLPKRTSWLGSQLCGKLVSKRDRAVPPSLHLPRGISSFLASKFPTENCYLDKKIREKVKHVPSRFQEINHTISQYYLLFLRRKSQIVSLFYFSRLLSRCTGKKWSRRTFSFQPGSFREPLLRLTSKQVPLLCLAIFLFSSSGSDHIWSLLDVQDWEAPPLATWGRDRITPRDGGWRWMWPRQEGSLKIDCSFYLDVQ